MENYTPSEISIETWVEMLKNPEIFDDKILALLKTIYGFEDHVATCTEVSNLIYGKKSCSFSNLIGITGKKVKENVNGTAIFKNDKQVYDPWLFNSKKVFKTKYELEMLKNLKEALLIIYPDLEVNYKHNNGNFPIIMDKKKLPKGYHDVVIEPKIKSNDKNNVWKIASGESSVAIKSWEEFKKDSYVGIGWFSSKKPDCINYQDFKSKEEIKEKLLKENKDTKKGTTVPTMIWNFAYEIKVGDYVVVNHGVSNVFGIGIITSEYIPPNKTDIKNSYDLNHIRKVKWLITEEFKVGNSFFSQQTLSQIKYNKWSQILGAYSNIHPEFKKEILKFLYNSYKKEYLDTKKGQIHSEAYDKERKEIMLHYNEIIQKQKDGKEVSDDVWEYLISPKNSIFKAYENAKNLFKSDKYKLSDSQLKDVALAYLKIVKDINNNDINKQDKILKEYSESNISKGIGTGVLSPTLFYTNPDHFAINNKTANTIELLSPFVDSNIIINTKLEEYIQNNAKIHDFLKKIEEIIPELGEFSCFDEFCHYICSAKLGGFTKGKILPLIGFDIEFEKEDILENMVITEDAFKMVSIKNEDFKLNFEMLKTDLKIKTNTIIQIFSMLNAGKNIILEGVPGTGKTELAIDIGIALKENNFCNGYILTTATSDWTTFDTIGGLMPDKEGNLEFNEGIFLRSIKENKLLIIDEINRADIDKAFGQLFTVLSGQSIELNYKMNGKPIKVELLKDNSSNNSYFDEDEATYYVGNNWRIIASMNTSDKDSLYELSYAFMRRFAFVNIDIPTQEVYTELINKWTTNLNRVYTQKIINLEQLFESKGYPKVGPAIFKDMSNYLNYRNEFDNTEYMLEESIISFILPQFEGLGIKQLNKIYNDFIYTLELNDEIIKSNMEEIFGIPLKLGNNNE